VRETDWRVVFAVIAIAFFLKAETALLLIAAWYLGWVCNRYRAERKISGAAPEAPGASPANQSQAKQAVRAADRLRSLTG
jgi:hypothetical protein